MENKIITGNDWSVINVPKDYASIFPVRTSLFGYKANPYNADIYRPSENGEVIRSASYAGIIPIIGDDKEHKEPVFAQIAARFLDPITMLNEVLKGNDYYDDPDMIKIKYYSRSEWERLEDSKEEVKELFGIVTGYGTVKLDYNSNDGESGKSDDYSLGNTFGLLEIFDFVAKAKNICRKNLKLQSEKIDENLNCKVKGKININKQIKYNDFYGRKQMVYCTYNKMSVNNKENQILKYALYICEKQLENVFSLAEDIGFCNNTLRGVALKKITASDFVGLKNNGAYKEYKTALEAARKIINRYSIIYSSGKDGKEVKAEVTVNKETPVTPYFINMNKLFELYARSLIRKALDEINEEDKNDKKAYRLVKFTDSKKSLFNNNFYYYMNTYIPDMIIEYGENKKPIMVLDAKYSDVGSQDPQKRERTHQIMFYMKALDVDYGGLVIPKTKDDKKVKFVQTETGNSFLGIIPIEEKKGVADGLKGALEKAKRNFEMRKLEIDIITELVKDVNKHLKNKSSIKNQVDELAKLKNNNYKE